MPPGDQRLLSPPWEGAGRGRTPGAISIASRLRFCGYAIPIRPALYRNPLLNLQPFLKRLVRQRLGVLTGIQPGSQFVGPLLTNRGPVLLFIGLSQYGVDNRLADTESPLTELFQFRSDDR